MLEFRLVKRRVEQLIFKTTLQLKLSKKVEVQRKFLQRIDVNTSDSLYTRCLEIRYVFDLHRTTVRSSCYIGAQNNCNGNLYSP